MIKIKSFILILLFAFNFGAISVFGQSNGFEVLKNLEIMDQIYEHLDLYFVDEPQNGKLSKVAIDAMLKELDPYTVYYHESNIQSSRLFGTSKGPIYAYMYIYI